MEETLKEYYLSWNLESMKNNKQPLMMVAIGSMEQVTSGQSFLGRVVEEKFHIKPFGMSILSCIPFVPERVKSIVHPDVVPTQLTDGIREGYYLVDLSLRQNFELGPEFFEAYNNGQHDNEGNSSVPLHILQQ